MKYLVFPLLLTAFSLNLFAQSATSCSTLATTPSSKVFVGSNSLINSSNPNNGGISSTDWGCLSTRPQQNWFYFEIQNSGTLNLIINNAPNTDYDAIIWGPISQNNLNNACAATTQNSIACDYNFTTSTVLNATNINSGVNSGEIYILLITNFDNINGSIDFLTSGTATVSGNNLNAPNSLTISPNSFCQSNPPNSISLNATGGLSNYSGILVDYYDDICNGNLIGTTNYNTPLVINTIPNSNKSYYARYRAGSLSSNCNSSTLNVIQSISIGTDSLKHLTCFNSNNGIIDANASGGIAPYSFLLEPGNISNSNGKFTLLNSGIYTISVSDGSVCNSSTSTFTINSPTNLIASVSTTTNVSCFGGNNGSATIISSGGTGNKTYSWTPSGGSAATASNLVAGTYTCTVTDANLCATTTTVLISQPTNLIASISTSTNVSCFGGNNGSATIISSGGTGNKTYSWTPSGGSAATASNLVAGTYTCTVTDANLCATTTTVLISQPTNLIASISTSTNVSCFGGNNGSATIISSGGTGNKTYSWAPSGGSAATASNLVAGTYTCTVTDANGCSKTTSATISQPTNLTATISASTNILCFGNNTGTATVTASGGTGNKTYSWTPSGGSAATASNLVAGTYTCTVTDANLCATTTTVLISQPTNLIASISTSTNVSCFGGNNGSATIISSGGTGNKTYSWTPSGGSAATASNLVAGTYTCTVTDANGCSKTTSATISQPTNLIASISTSTNVSCFGGNNGSATIISSGGTGNKTYSWAPSGGSAATASNLVAGTYTCTVTDANGCSKTTSATISQPTNLTATISASTNILCFGNNTGTATVTVSGGTGNKTYSWTPSGGSAATASNLVAGTYTCTVTDANLCATTTTVLISQPTNLIASISTSTNVSCFGGNNGSATIISSGGTGNKTYSWTPSGGSAATASNLVAGTYTCTVTDANGCSKTTSATISQPTNLTATISASTNILCFGNNTGTATVTASGGTGNKTYSWAPSGGSAATASNLVAGTYTCMVTDANLCATTTTVLISQPTNLIASISTSTNVSCFGGNNGSATIISSGGTGNKTYSWTPSGGSAATASNLVAGTYTCTVTDANLCATTTTVLISQPTNLIASISTSTNVSCFGGNNGSATIISSGGTGNKTYSWTPSGGSAATASNLVAGTYTCTVTDANLCATTTTVLISQPTNLIASISTSTNVSCFGGNNGSATIISSGGTGNKTYSWTPSGGSAATASNLVAGTYTCTVTDANGCSKTTSATISQPTNLIASISTSTNVSCFGGNNGSATIISSGGTGNKTYSWAPSGGSAATASNLVAGTYTCTVTDANGCSKTTSATISQPTNLTATISASTNILCFGNNTGTATVTVSGGTGNKTYSWTPSGGSAATASNLVAGTYTCTVTDANLCATTTTVLISQPTNLIASISTSTNVSCFGGNNGSATIISSGGTGNKTYSWTPSGGSAATASNLVAGTYTCTVTDANGCSKTTSATISQPTNLTATISASTNILCFGNNTGTATVTASGGTGNKTYSWAPSGGSAATASNLVAGTYTCMVTDANLCATTTTVLISQPTNLIASISTSTNVSCFGGNNGSATIISSGGTGNKTYSWTPSGGSAATASNLVAGTYTCTVTDANLCATTTTVLISQPTNLIASISTSTNVSCFGGNNGSATIISSGGSGNKTYSWTPSGGSAATASNLVAGTYTCTVTDANLCAKTTSVLIAQPTNLIATISTSTNVSCFGGNNGSATVTVSGGTGNKTYSWAPSGGSASTASNLVAGTYTCTVTDANLCAKTTSVLIAQPTNLIASISTSTNVSCFGGNNGSATVTTSGGTGNKTYSWAPSGGSASTASNLVAGTYTCTVTDANLCAKTTSVLIAQPTNLIASISTSTNVSCFGGNNGSATVTVSGGTGNKTYSWAPSGGSASTASNLVAGTYTCTVTDANLCGTTTTVVINTTSNLNLVISDTSICTNSTFNLQNLNTNGSTGNFMLTFYDQNFTNLLSNFVQATAGTYGIIATEGICKDSVVVSISESSTSEIGLTASNNNISVIGSICDLVNITDSFNSEIVSNNCNTLFYIEDIADSNSLGSTVFCINVDSNLPTINNQLQLSRYYQITPTNQHPANLTLYFTQNEIENYNLNNSNGPDFVNTNNTISINILKVNNQSFTTIPSIATWDAANNRWQTTFYVNSFSTFYFSPNNTTLPVTWHEFYGKNNLNTNEIYWSTIQELNNDYFILQRSIDNKNFEDIAKINSKALNNSTKTSYSYLDKNITTNLFYRIKQVDIDEKSTTSETILIQYQDNQLKNLIQVYPNPFNEFIQIDIPIKNDIKNLKIVDIFGKTVISKSDLIPNSINKIETTQLQSGIYFGFLEYEDFNTFQFKIIKN